MTGRVKMSVCYRSNKVNANGMSCFCLSLFVHTSLFFPYNQSLYIDNRASAVSTLASRPRNQKLTLLQQDVWFKEDLRGSPYRIKFVRRRCSRISKPQVPGWRTVSHSISVAQRKYSGVPRPVVDTTSKWDLKERRLRAVPSERQ